MSPKNTSDNLIIREFTAPKQIKLFTSLQKARLSGRLTFSDPVKGDEWHVYLYQGDFVYATGGIHPIRRWQRNLILNLPQIPLQLSHLQEELTQQRADLKDNIWEYEQLSRWVQEQVITPQQAKNTIAFVISEIIFDLTQARQVICRLNQDNVLAATLELIEPESVITQIEQVWSLWQEAQVVDRLPNMAPVILQPQQLQEKTSISAYQSLCKLLNGNRTLRDLSVQLRTSPLQVICSLLPYIQSGIFGLVDIPDLLEIVNLQSKDYEHQDRPLIACVDDSPMVSHLMEQIVSMAGYRFLAVNDPQDAAQVLMSCQPDLIFLDVVMPKVSGYDLCAQLRRYPEFTQTPIIFLTSSSGVVDRLRARMVGSSDFLRKTVDADELVQKIEEHLGNR
ncbi:MAG: response regulator [Pleurocapsa minor HA4230-MV1]|jgi:chemotaxis family two-component system response regulator PixG|nr:response regulator [Pleurocapsa minor HA4230-MV1]